MVNKYIKKCATSEPFSMLLLLSLQVVCDPMDCTLPDSSVLGISQARILERVAISLVRLLSKKTVCSAAFRLNVLSPSLSLSLSLSLYIYIYIYISPGVEC